MARELSNFPVNKTKKGVYFQTDERGWNAIKKSVNKMRKSRPHATIRDLMRSLIDGLEQ